MIGDCVCCVFGGEVEMARWEVLRLEADGWLLLNGCWKGDKEDWRGVMELEGEGNGGVL